MKRRVFLLAGLLLPLSIHAQSRKLVRIGVLLFGNPQNDSSYGAFRAGLKDLGYAEGRNVVFVERFAEGRPERLRDLAAQLVAEKPDVIIAIGGDVAPYARAATGTIPIVVVVSNDPVQSGLVASLARPGGNVTGVTFVSSDLAAKRMQILKDIAPKIARVGVLWNPDHVDPEYREFQQVGQRLGVAVVSLEVRSSRDFDAAFRTAVDARIDAMLPVTSRLVLIERKRIMQFAAERQLPIATGFGSWADEGALFTYAPDTDAATRTAATHVDKILKGANPGELPIERPTQFQLIVNARTAKTLGLTLPRDLLVRADKVIE